jgi:hypothetical protein
MMILFRKAEIENRYKYDALNKDVPASSGIRTAV